MIQSPRGSIDIIAHNSFDTQTPDDTTHKDRHIETYTDTNTDNTDSSNQLVWSNPIQQHLPPQKLRPLLRPLSNTLLLMAQSAKTPLGVNSFWEAGTTPPMKAMVLHT